jgi:hypothetical protein
MEIEEVEEKESLGAARESDSKRSSSRDSIRSLSEEPLSVTILFDVVADLPRVGFQDADSFVESTQVHICSEGTLRKVARKESRNI